MCLPNEQLSALVEFCYIGDQTLIEPGYMIVVSVANFDRFEL